MGSSRAALKALLDPTSSRYVEGTEEDRQRARAEWHRQRYIGQVMGSSLEEIPRSDLSFGRFGIVEHVPSGRLYRARRDGIIDLSFVDAAAYYCDQAGTPVLLEPPSGPQSRQELEQRRLHERSGATSHGQSRRGSDERTRARHRKAHEPIARP
jgi:hypothetical protein